MITQESIPEYSHENIASCPLCKSTNLVEDPKTGELICENCGLVVVEKGYSLDQDWRAFTLTEKNQRSRTGYMLTNTIYDHGLSTTFNSDIDAKGKKLDPETQNMMLRLKKQDQRAKVNLSSERNLKIALSEMSKSCNELHLPDHVHEKAAQIYRLTLKEDLVRGRSIDGFVAASILAACRKNKIPRSILDISKATNLPERSVKFHYRLLLKEFNMKMPIDRPTKFISSLSSKLNLTGEVEQYSVRLMDKARENNLIVGKNPRGVAAAVLYLACQETGTKITQSEVARAAKTSEVTMRKRFKEYEPLIGQLSFN